MKPDYSVSRLRHREKSVGYELILRAAVVSPSLLYFSLFKRLVMVDGGYGRVDKTVFEKLVIGKRVYYFIFRVEIFSQQFARFRVAFGQFVVRFVRDMKINRFPEFVLLYKTFEFRYELS